MHRGYVKLWRRSLDSAVWQNPTLWRFWCWCLLRATHAAKTELVGFQRVDLAPGQFVFGRLAAARATGLSEQQVRSCLKALAELGALSTRAHSKFSVASIAQWETYQSQSVAGEGAARRSGRQPAGQISGQPARQQPERQPEQQAQQPAARTAPAGAAEALPESRSPAATGKVSGTTPVQPAAQAPGSPAQAATDKKPKHTATTEATAGAIAPAAPGGQYTPSFEAFWAAYPSQKGKAAAFQAWKAVPLRHPGVTPARLMAALAAQAAADHFRGHDGQRYIPNPATWLNQGRWDDAVRTCAPEASLSLEERLALARGQGQNQTLSEAGNTEQIP